MNNARRPRIAAVVTVYRLHSHAQHIIDRFLEGYGWDGRYHKMQVDLVSLYVDQVFDNDLSRERKQRFPDLRLSETIEEALTLGTGKLDVDGVILVGEHGEYDYNDKEQHLYPRYELFQQIVDVFKKSGRSVPVFNDKHLSWHWPWARRMYDTASEMGFALMAGSSVPVAPRVPEIAVPDGAKVKEAMCISYGGVDSYDFHALELIQCMVERRRGGETGVKWVKAYRGENFWKAHESGQWSAQLFEACIARCNQLKMDQDGYDKVWPTLEQMKIAVKDPVAYQYEHTDGALATMILLNGLVSCWTFAGQLEGDDAPISCRVEMPMPSASNTLVTFFAALSYHIENLFLTGKSPYPVERTLLTTGLVAAGVESLYQHQSKIDTAHLSSISYQPPPADIRAKVA